MNSNQYKQVAQTTMNQALELGADELTAVRAACDNLGVALPNGTSGEVAETLATNDYMGWRACTAEEAQAAANEGVAALYTDGEAVSLVLPDAEVTALGSGTYYIYNAASTTTVIPPEEDSIMTNVEYYNIIHQTPLLEPSSSGTTYCNIWAQNVLRACGVPYATGGCTKELTQYVNGSIEGWSECTFQDAQRNANNGKPTIGIEPSHQVVVTPNNVNHSGEIPSVVGGVLVSQSGSDCFYDKTLSWSWSVSDRDKVRFFSYGV